MSPNPPSRHAERLLQSCETSTTNQAFEAEMAEAKRIRAATIECDHDAISGRVVKFDGDLKSLIMRRNTRSPDRTDN